MYPFVFISVQSVGKFWPRFLYFWHNHVVKMF